MSDIDGRIAALEAELAALKASVAADPPDADGTSRRHLLRNLAVGAAGVAAASAGAVKFAGPAAADDGGNLILGTANTATSQTSLTTTLAATGTAVVFQSGATPTPAPPTGAYPSAVAGYAFTAGTPHAVLGFSNQPTGYAVAAFNTGGTGVLAKGPNRANIELIAEGAPAPTRTATDHAKGEVVVDSNGDLWFCVVGSTAPNAATWRRLSGTATAGSLHVLASPVRVYDSRSGTGPAAKGQGLLPGLQTRAVDLKNGFVGTTATPAVPVGATAAMFTLTVADTVGAGFLAAYSAAVPNPGTSTINWANTGDLLATTTVSAVDGNANINVSCGGSVQGTNFIVDVIGYYR